MALLLVLLCMSLVIVKGEGSHCMATTSGALISLYQRVCCVSSNLGQAVHMKENSREKIIICPPVKPHSCPPSGNLNCINYCNNDIILIYQDCKSWFDKGYNRSGVYTINPDGQTPFEVRG